VTRRISFTILGVTIVAMVAFAVPFGVAVERSNHDAAILELQRIATTAASQLPNGVMERTTPVSLPVLQPEVRLSLYDRAGTMVAGKGPPTSDDVATAALDGTVHDGVVGSERVVAVPVVQGDEVIGVMRASEPASEATDTTRRTWMWMAGLAVVVVAAAAVAANLLARRLTRPVRRLRDAAVRLGDGDFTVTPPISGLTELDDAADALTTTARHIGRLVERERAFSADASHQLRTPLTSLRLTLESELLNPRADPVPALEDALRDVDRIEATLTHLLALARDVPEDRGPLAVDGVLRAAEQRWRRPFVAAGRSVVVDAGDDVPVVHASAAALATVVDVLVENSLQHGAGTVVLAAAATRPTGVCITVTDEGILSGDPSGVFERRASDATGHGIGLALARSLAHAEGAQLRVARSAPTTFELLVPEHQPRSTAEFAVR
jgi:signal transduction histidine kinase